VGVSVDPLGEVPAPIVLPDGFMLELGPVDVERAGFPAVLPVVLPPLIDEPVVVPPAAGLPTAELPLAEPLPLWANANVLESARTEASAMVEILMVVSSLACPGNKSRRGFMFRMKNMENQAARACNCGQRVWSAAI
jgi:hypothetical protein